jgi:hypothetical protein
LHSRGNRCAMKTKEPLSEHALPTAACVRRRRRPPPWTRLHRRRTNAKACGSGYPPGLRPRG